MRLILLALLITSTASCALRQPQIEYVEVPVHVPQELRVPAKIEPVTETDPARAAAQGVTNALIALDQANGQILAIDCILDSVADPDDPRTCTTTEGSE